MDDAAFRDRLRAAFPPTPIDITGIWGPRGTTYLDAHEYKQHVAGRTWDQLDRAFIARRNDALSFLAPSHVAMVLPAYLDIFVTAPVDAPTENVLYILTRAEPTDPTQFEGLNERRQRKFDALVDVLTPEQRVAIADALEEFLVRHPGWVRDVTPALDRYWNRYLGEEKR